MKKLFILSFMLMILTLTPFMHVLAAPPPTFIWDDLQFVYDGYGDGAVKYPHPDRELYEISPFVEWSRRSYQLLHVQWDYAKSVALEIAAPIVGAAIGATIGAMLGGGVVGGAVGGIVGLVLPAILDLGVLLLALDEAGCIWWWISLEFYDWLQSKLWDIFQMSILNPGQAITWVLSVFLVIGYLRVGSVTFYDAIGIKWCSGDINNDFKVDMRDIGIVAQAFGSTPGSPYWNPDADVNHDGIVDMADISQVARFFGKAYPSPSPI